MLTKIDKLKFSQKAKKKAKLNYLREVQRELKKVSWTTKDELILSTKIVIGATFFLGMGIYLFDLLIRSLLDVLGLLAKLIGG